MFAKVEYSMTSIGNTMSEERLDALILLEAHRDLLPG